MKSRVKIHLHPPLCQCTIFVVIKVHHRPVYLCMVLIIFKKIPSFWYDGENLSGLSYQAAMAYATFSDSSSKLPFNWRLTSPLIILINCQIHVTPYFIIYNLWRCWVMIPSPYLLSYQYQQNQFCGPSRAWTYDPDIIKLFLLFVS